MKRKIVACCLLGFLASYVGCSPSNESGGSGANSSEVENFAGYTTYEDQEPRDIPWLLVFVGGVSRKVLNFAAVGARATGFIAG